MVSKMDNSTIDLFFFYEDMKVAKIKKGMIIIRIDITYSTH